MNEQWPWIAAVVATLALIGGIVFFDAKGSAPASSTIDAEIATIADGEWTKGPASAPVTIIEYSDFQCPACGNYYPILKEVVAQRPDQVRFVYRHFPLPSHANASGAGKAAEAAGKQGKFWEMHDRIFERQGDWSEAGNAAELFTTYAGELGLNVDQFKADVASDGVDDAVDADKSSGNKAGVTSTPTFIVNGERLEDNPNSLEAFLTLIDAKATNATPTP